MVVDLLGCTSSTATTLFTELLEQLRELRAKVGRPHSIVVDEAHHLLRVVESIRECVTRSAARVILVTCRRRLASECGPGRSRDGDDGRFEAFGAIAELASALGISAQLDGYAAAVERDHDENTFDIVASPTARRPARES